MSRGTQECFKGVPRVSVACAILGALQKVIRGISGRIREPFKCIPIDFGDGRLSGTIIKPPGRPVIL